MSKKAVDVALLPSDNIIDIAIRLNRQLVERFGEEIVLDNKNCLPHISLAMGCIEEGDIPEIAGVLTKIAGENPVGELRIAGVKVSENAKGERVSSFEVERTENLQRLHEEIVEAMQPYFVYEVTEDI